MYATLVEDKTKEAGAYKIRFSIGFSSFIPKEENLSPASASSDRRW